MRRVSVLGDGTPVDCAMLSCASEMILMLISVVHSNDDNFCMFPQCGRRGSLTGCRSAASGVHSRIELPDLATPLVGCSGLLGRLSSRVRIFRDGKTTQRPTKTLTISAPLTEGSVSIESPDAVFLFGFIVGKHQGTYSGDDPSGRR